MHSLPTIRSLSLLLAIMLGTVVLGSCSNGDHSAGPEELNTRGVELLTTASGDITQLQMALDVFSAALKQDPNYQPAVANKLTTELALGYFRSAYDSVQRLITLSEKAQYHLLACAIMEVGELESVSSFSYCYEAAASAMERKLGDGAADDPNYLLALKLAGAGRFEATARKFIGAKSSETEKEIYETMFFVDSRKDTLRGLMPAAF